MKDFGADIHKELTSFSIEKKQKLSISMISYISLESKTKLGQSRMNKTHNSRYLLRDLWKLDYLGSIQINRSTSNFISSRGYSIQCKVNKILERFLNKQNTIQVLLCFKKIVYYIQFLQTFYKACQLYQTYLSTTFTRASYGTVPGLFKVHLSSFSSLISVRRNRVHNSIVQCGQLATTYLQCIL